MRSALNLEASGFEACNSFQVAGLLLAISDQDSAQVQDLGQRDMVALHVSGSSVQATSRATSLHPLRLRPYSMLERDNFERGSRIAPLRHDRGETAAQLVDDCNFQGITG